MRFIPSDDPMTGTRDLAAEISKALMNSRKALWLICGGSNIPYAVEAMRLVRATKAKDHMEDLIVAQTDERYGAVGHKDSNWQQMLDAGMDLSGVTAIPVLVGMSLEATVSDYASRLKPAMDGVGEAGGIIIGQFGIGPDGHIAGLLPFSTAINDPRLVSGYEGGAFVRISLTAVGIMKIDAAYVFAFGETKRQPLENLRDKDLTLEEEPCSILKNMPEVAIYSDVLG